MNIGLLLKHSALHVALVLGFALALASQASAEVLWFKTCSYSTYAAKQYLPRDEFKTEEQISALPSKLQKQVKRGSGESRNGEFLSYMDNQTRSFLALLKESGNDLRQVASEESPDFALKFFTTGENPLLLRAEMGPFWMPAELATSPQPSELVRYLDSPWVRIKQSFENGKCKLDVLFLWNWRQFVTDQSNLHDVQPISMKATRPEDVWPYEYLQKFESLVIDLEGDTWLLYLKSLGRTSGLSKKEKQELIVDEISDEFPPDLLWFFRSIPLLDPDINSNGKAPTELADDEAFNYRDYLLSTLYHMSKFYVDDLPRIVNPLTKHFLSTDKKIISIRSILDLGTEIGPEGKTISEQSKLRMPEGIK
jgi:hypothetical protein